MARLPRNRPYRKPEPALLFGSKIEIQLNWKINSEFRSECPAYPSSSNPRNTLTYPVMTPGLSPGSKYVSNSGSNARPSRRAKRVRTGCLVCRERHLKCDEAGAPCGQCMRGNRECKYGVKLKFDHFTEVSDLHTTIPIEGKIHFQDDTAYICSLYGDDSLRELKKFGFNESDALAQLSGLSHRIPDDHGALANPVKYQLDASGTMDLDEGPSSTQAVAPTQNGTPVPQSSGNTAATDDFMSVIEEDTDGEGGLPIVLPKSSRPMIQDPFDMMLMKCYIEEIGAWMDSLNSIKYVCAVSIS